MGGVTQQVRDGPSHIPPSLLFVRHFSLSCGHQTRPSSPDSNNTLGGAPSGNPWVTWLRVQREPVGHVAARLAGTRGSRGCAAADPAPSALRSRRKPHDAGVSGSGRRVRSVTRSAAESTLWTGSRPHETPPRRTAKCTRAQGHPANTEDHARSRCFRSSVTGSRPESLGRDAQSARTRTQIHTAARSTLGCSTLCQVSKSSASGACASSEEGVANLRQNLVAVVLRI